MSKESVRKFYEMVSKDADLQRRFREKGESFSEKYGVGAIGDEHLEELLQKEVLPIAREAGFEFSFQELQEYSAESKTKGEIMDEELAAVAGGGDLCVCVMGGFGSFGDVNIGCVVCGAGMSKDFFCVCLIGGGGGPT